MSDDELARRVAARLTEAEQSQDLTQLLSDSAVTDALSLLSQAAPAPDVIVEFGPVILVCWTFWYRAGGGDRNPTADQDAVLALALRNILRPLLPDPSVLPSLSPGVAEEEFDALTRLSGFACLMGSACGELAAHAMRRGSRSEATALFDQGIVWLQDAYSVMPTEHDGFGDVSMAIIALRMRRFEEFAEPESLAGAARTAIKACAVVPSSHPRQGTHRPLMLDVVARAAVMLGEPGTAEIEDLLASSGITPLPETAQRLAQLSDLARASPTESWEFDAAVGSLLYATAVEHDELPTLACATVRLRTALVTMPPDHPGRGSLTMALRDALTRLGQDDTDLPEPPSQLPARIDAAIVAFFGLAARKTGPRIGQMASLLDQILLLAEELARRRGLSGLPADVRAAIAFADWLSSAYADEPTDRPLERIDRYRRAFDALGAHHAGRRAYGTILAATAQQRAEAVAREDSRLSAELSALAADVAARVTADSPADFEPMSWLRAGHPQEATLGALSTLATPVWSAESLHALDVLGSATLRALAEFLNGAAASVKQDLGGDFEAIKALLSLRDSTDSDRPATESVIRDLRTAFDRLGSDDDLREAGGELLSATLRADDLRDLDPSTISNAAELLRQVYQQSAHPSVSVSGTLNALLTLLAAVTGDPALVIEAAAIEETARQAGPDDSAAGAQESFRNTYFKLVTRLLSYVLTHDREQLERAQRSLPRLIELGEQADAEQVGGVGEHRKQAESLGDLIELVGPGGGPTADITDELVDRCRRSYQAAPAGQRREFAGMTLVRALLQRSRALREPDPAHSARLTDEAETVIDAIGQGLDANLVALMRALTGLQRGGPGELIAPGYLQPVPRSGGEGTRTAFRAIETVTAQLLASIGDLDSMDSVVGTLRSPHLSVWMRAQAGFAAAARAARTKTSNVDLALSLGAETVGLLEKLTDRGGPQHAAEHSLLGFDGDIRGLATHIVLNLLLRRNGPILKALQERYEALLEATRRGLAGDDITTGDLAEGPIRALTGSEVEAVVALHERGRGLLLARRLESRTDLDAVGRAHPELAAEFAQLTGRLEAGTGGDSDRARLAGQRTSTELDQLIERIRTQPGFEDFLRPLTPDQLRALATDGPIVVLNHVRKMSCIAFIVTPEKMTALRLDVMAEEVTDAAQRLGQAIESIYARGSRRPPLSELIAAGNTLHDVLSWTWHAVLEPILDCLGHREPVRPGADWPRIWWVPTGPFNALPLHAAQCLRGDCETGRCGSALDTVVSSFIPGFQTLAYARARATRGQGSGAERALVVSESDDVLPGAVAAARSTAEALATPKLLVGEVATRDAVLDALANSQWVQFGCHAHSSPDLPAGSWIQLPSGEALSVQDICRIRPDSARLAVLTACGTARTAERLTDEAVHVSSAFLLAGYPEAIGTLWEIDSAQIGTFLQGFYRRALADGSTAPYALHHTVRELRDLAPDRPYVWAAYLHAGA